jgi:predicted histone-like DNA-binding protein
MIELYLSKVTENSETETAGKMYARVSYKQSMDLHDMAQHMAEHNTAFSEGLIVGVLTDFVKCVREMVLNGNTVKVGNLAIFKATVESNGLEVLYDAQNDKVASATLGVLKEGDKTGAAVKTIKLLAQSTGDFTREELKKDVKLSWTDKTKAEIAAAKGSEGGGSTDEGTTGNGTTGNGTTNSGDQNQGGSSQGGGTNTGGNTGGGGNDDDGGGQN